MTTDHQVRRLRMLIQTEETQAIAAAKAGMDEKTARKYLNSGELPSQSKKGHTWRTRGDPFEREWEEIIAKLTLTPGLEAKTIFDALQREKPGELSDGQLRTLQRRIKIWRATEGPAREIFFPQEHYPGDLCASDFTDMNRLGVRIGGQPFEHLVYHFVLTYSNWETGSLCFSESYESLSEGMQNALWELGGAPKRHRTDRLSAAVHKACNPEEFTQRYRELLSHYGIKGEKIRAGEAHENGDIEQRHHRFKSAVEQALMLRGSCDFAGRVDYEQFLKTLFKQLNAGRRERFTEELKVLGNLPPRRVDDCKKERVKVGPSSTVRIVHNTYSVHSRLKGEWVEARVYAQRIEIWYAQRKVETLPRLKGENKYRINYRHIIDWLVRKPGAFEHYRYREELFPGSSFRMAYDDLKAKHVQPVANREYLKILYLAATESECAVEWGLRQLLGNGETISIEAVKIKMGSDQQQAIVDQVRIAEVALATYDDLLEWGRQEVTNG
jgi:transposase InsO family protein